jgi:tagaturonate reductase
MAMKHLDRELLNDEFPCSFDLHAGVLQKVPEKVLQFGEGNFLRGYADWMFHEMNKRGVFQGSITAMNPTNRGSVESLNRQNGIYTLLLRGLQEGKVVENREVITSIRRGINPYKEYDEFLKCAENADLRIIVSNTTEAGINLHPDDRYEDTPPVSFPAKLTVLLHKRYKAFGGESSKGVIILPCELIEKNGETLKRMILELAERWMLQKEFTNWLEVSCHFLNTLVDRIVPGYPKDEAEELTGKLGYRDDLLVTAEPYHLLVIEGDAALAEELPFHKAGLNVIWTKDLTPYRTRKVRILNGAHTMTVLAAFLSGKDTVKECIDDEIMNAYMLKGIREEVIPTLDMPQAELAAYADTVLERFANPFIRHYLLSISLNSVSKFKTRVLPSILEYVKRKDELPSCLTFSLAALLAFYRGVEIRGTALLGRRNGIEYCIQDSAEILEMFKTFWSHCDGSRTGIELLAATVLGRTDLWDADLNNVKGLTVAVSEHLYNILNRGIVSVMKGLVK